MENEHNGMSLLDFIYRGFKGLWRAIKRLGNFLLLLLRFSIQNILIIAAFVMLSLVAGWFFTRPAFTMFTGETTILFMAEARPAVLDHIALLNSHCRSKRLATDLNLSDSITNKIRRFEIFNYVYTKNVKIPALPDFSRSSDSVTDTATVVMTDRFYVRIFAKGLTDFKPVKAGLERYFDNQKNMDFLSERGLFHLNQKIDAYTWEVKRLDSLATYEYFSSSKPIELQGSKTFVFAQKEKELFHQELFSLIDKRDRMIRQRLEHQHNVNFQSDIVLYGPLLLRRLALWLLGGYIFGAFVAWGIVRRKDIRAFLKK